MSRTLSIKAIEAIAAAYGLEYAHVAKPERGYRNHVFRITMPDGGFRSLIQYKREPGIVERIRRANAIGAHLRAAGLPVRAPADPRVLKMTGRTTTYTALYTYLPGHTISWEAYTRRHIKLLGAALGQLHHHTAGWESSCIQSHAAAAEMAGLHQKMAFYFKDPSVRAAIQAKLGFCVSGSWLNAQPALLTHMTSLPGQQALHLDFVRSNMLFDAAEPHHTLQLDGLALTGIIDFEKTAWGHPLLDVARTLAFLLVDCRHKTPNQVRKYFLYSGYVKRGGGVVGQIRRPGRPSLILDELVDWYLVYDLYKFLRHTPYESLFANQHFLRTVLYLKHRQIIK